MAVSRWERAVNEPESAYYLQLGTLAGDPDCWFFWQRAGLAAADLSKALRRGAQQAKARAIAAEQERQGSGTSSVPFLQVTAASDHGIGDSQPQLETLPSAGEISVPAAWTPNPATTRCIRLSGDGLAPELLDGSIIAVDLAQNDLSKLDGEFALVFNESSGLRVQRLGNGAEGKPLERGFQVLGRVIWYVVRAV